MVKVLSSRLQMCLRPFLTCCLSKVPLKQEFLDIYLITFCGYGNFGNTSHMRPFFSWKCSKFNVHFRNEEKNWEKAFSFWDTSIWIGCVKLSLLRREYFSSSVNMLTNSLQILHSTKRNFFQLNYLHSDQ